MFSQSCVSGFHRISDRVESRARSRLSATTPSWRHIWSSTHTKRPSLDHTRNCQPSPNQLSNFNFLRGHRLPPNRCHRFGHPRTQTTPHHSIIHTPKMIVYLAPNKFRFSKGSPPPTLHSSQIRSSTRTNNSAQFDHPLTANTSPPYSTSQISLFYGVTASHPSTTHAHDANNHPYPQYTSHCSPTPSSFGGKSER